jgi:hypothetical protein
MYADVTEGCGTEHGIGDGVRHDVCIGMTHETNRVGHMYAAQHERALGAKAV